MRKKQPKMKMKNKPSELDIAVDKYLKNKNQMSSVRREASMSLLNKPTSSFINSNLPTSPRITRVGLYPDKPNKGTKHNSVEERPVTPTTAKLSHSPIRYSVLGSKVSRFGPSSTITGGPGQYVDNFRRGLNVKEPQRPNTSFVNQRAYHGPPPKAGAPPPAVTLFPDRPRSGDPEFRHASLFGPKGYAGAATDASLVRFRQLTSARSLHAPEMHRTFAKDIATQRMAYSQQFRSTKPRFTETHTETNNELGPGAFDHTLDGKSVGSPDFHARGTSQGQLIRMASTGKIPGLDLNGELDAMRRTEASAFALTQESQSARAPHEPSPPPRMGSSRRFDRGGGSPRRAGPRAYDPVVAMMAHTA